MTLKPSTKYTKIGFLVFSVGSSIGEEQELGIVKIWAEDKASFHQLTVPYEAQIQRGYVYNIVLYTLIISFQLVHWNLNKQTLCLESMIHHSILCYVT